MAYTPHTWQTGETVDAAKLNANEQGTQAAAAAADTANAGLSGKVNSSTYTAGLATKADAASLATVATSGSYADLSNKPTIPAGLPTQTGNSGKFLTTDGTAASWGTPAGGGGAGLPATVVNKTAAYTAAAGDFVQADATSAGFTVTLPAAPAVGALVAVKKVDATANTLTIAPSGGGTIDGDPTATTTTKMAGAIFEHVGTNVWRVVASMTTGGPAGVGVPAGGTSGQVLSKKSITDYDTQWVTPSSGGGAAGSTTGAAGIVGNWYFCSEYRGSTNSNQTLADGTASLGLPLVLRDGITIDALGCYVVTANASATLRLAIYQITGTSPFAVASGQAFGTKLAEVSGVSAAATGRASATLTTPLALSAGTAIAIAVVPQGAAVAIYHCSGNDWNNPWGSTDIINGPVGSVRTTGVSGALPATFTPTTIVSTNIGGAGWFHRSA